MKGFDYDGPGKICKVREALQLFTQIDASTAKQRVVLEFPQKFGNSQHREKSKARIITQSPARYSCLSENHTHKLHEKNPHHHYTPNPTAMPTDTRQRAFTCVWSGAAIGTLGGLMGLGGAEFRLPVLVGVLGLAARAAVPVNLAVSFIVLIAALPARATTISLDAILPHLPEVLGMASGSVVAAYVGAGLLKRVSDRALGTLILGLLMALGVVMIGDAFLNDGGAGLVPQAPMWRTLASAACGILIGLVSSLLGVAGGELIIPAFALGFGVPVKLAGSMSMLVGLPTIAAGLIRHLRDPACPLRAQGVWRDTVGPLGAGSVLGAVAGGLLLGLVPADVLKVTLGVILIWSAFRTFAHQK